MYWMKPAYSHKGLIVPNLWKSKKLKWSSRLFFLKLYHCLLYVCALMILKLFCYHVAKKTSVKPVYIIWNYHSWTSASRPMLPASASWHSASQSSTRAFIILDLVLALLRYFPHSKYTGLTGCRTVQQFKKAVGKWKEMHPAKQQFWRAGCIPFHR